MDGRSLARLKRELEAFVGELLADVPRRGNCATGGWSRWTRRRWWGGGSMTWAGQ